MIFLGLADIFFSAVLCPNFTKRGQREYEGPWGKNGKCGPTANKASRKRGEYAPYISLKYIFELGGGGGGCWSLPIPQ